MDPTKIAWFDDQVRAFSAERGQFVALHSRVAKAHPDWAPRNDARICLLGKQVNFLFTTIVNLRLLQHAVDDMRFWSLAISRELDRPDKVAPAVFELITFYRVATLVFVFSAVEHGMRAMLRTIRPSAQADGPFYSVYIAILRSDCTVAHSRDHINLLDFLRTLRNTIHNNGVFLPTNGKNVDFTIAGRTYQFRVGRQADFFGWDTLLHILPPLRTLLSDLMDAPEIEAISFVEDVATHA